MAASSQDLGGVRRPYGRLVLQAVADHERDEPLRLVARWLDEAVASGAEPEPTAMTLATVSLDAGAPTPDARVVLCKGIDTGLVFYTNRASAKGRQLAATPSAAAVFLWPTLERQVRVRGAVEEVDDATSDAYFATRPRGSQLNAWASAQSSPVADRATLQDLATATAARFGDGPVPRPPGWGGYRLEPSSIELWQGQPDRLHDRLRFDRVGDTWDAVRLQP